MHRHIWNRFKTPKFLICENPIGKDPGRIFLLHAREPIILAEAYHFDIDQQDDWLRCKASFSVGASVDYPGELICLGALVVAPSGKLATMSPQQQADILARIMSRMGDWYHAYLKFEDDNIRNYQ